MLWGQKISMMLVISFKKEFKEKGIFNFFFFKCYEFGMNIFLLVQIPPTTFDFLFFSCLFRVQKSQESDPHPVEKR